MRCICKRSTWVAANLKKATNFLLLEGAEPEAERNGQQQRRRQQRPGGSDRPLGQVLLDPLLRLYDRSKARTGKWPWRAPREKS